MQVTFRKIFRFRIVNRHNYFVMRFRLKILTEQVKDYRRRDIERIKSSLKELDN